MDWLKGSGSFDTLPLVSLVNREGVWAKGGPEYEAGIYDVDTNFSLVINHVQIEHSDVYFCRVAPFQTTAKRFTNQTKVRVFGKYDISRIPIIMLKATMNYLENDYDFFLLHLFGFIII